MPKGGKSVRQKALVGKRFMAEAKAWILKDEVYQRHRVSEARGG